MLSEGSRGLGDSAAHIWSAWLDYPMFMSKQQSYKVCLLTKQDQEVHVWQVKVWASISYSFAYVAILQCLLTLLDILLTRNVHHSALS